jgi:hypothetical protein
MLIKKTSVLLLLMVLVFTGCNTSAVRKDSPAATPDENAYAALLERAKNSDSTVDFRELRVLYSRTPAYSPLPDGDYEAMQKAFGAGKDERALKLAGRVLERNYVNIDAHLVNMTIHSQTGDTEKLEHDDFMLKGLIGSILDSGDGTSPETAFEVITVREEYLLLEVLGFEMKKQSTLDSDGHTYDMLEVSDPKTGKSGAIYFNVDIPFSGYARILGEQ